MAILSEKDFQFWEENGYVVVPEAAPKADLQAVIDAIWEFTGKNPDNPNEWYQEPMVGSGMVNMSHNQALWNNRQQPRIHQAYADIWGSEKLWITYDRANMNPPVGPQWNHDGFIHWDMDVTMRPIELCVQGVLYLTDTAENQGGFQCVPGSHRQVIEWGKTHRRGAHPTKEQIMAGSPVKSIPGRAGDLLIWHSALLHGNGRNTSDRPRFAQYVAMMLQWTHRTFRGATKVDERTRQGRISTWQDAPCQRAVAEALGLPEGFVEQWLREVRDNEHVVVQVNKVINEVDGVGQKVEINGESHDLRGHAIRRVSGTSFIVQRRYAERRQIPYTAVHDNQAVETLRKIPEPRFKPRLITAQLHAMSDLLAENKAWSPKSIVEAMEQAFGFTFDLRPAKLTALGKKLVGVELWT